MVMNIKWQHILLQQGHLLHTLQAQKSEAENSKRILEHMHKCVKYETEEKLKEIL